MPLLLPHCRARFIASLAGAVLIVAPVAAGAQQPDQPVMVGEGHDLDACMGVGIVVGLEPERDDGLAVRAGPSADSVEVGRLPLDRLVWICDGEGEWTGIVYGDTGPRELSDCGVSAPIPVRQPYDGSCASGWVPAVNILLIAG